MLLAMAGIGGKDAASLSAVWSDISATYPTAEANEDRTVSWDIGGDRTVTTSYSGVNTLNYRLDSGSWTDSSGGFTMSSGQTLGWQITAASNEGPVSVIVYVDGVELDTFTVTVTGAP